MLERFLGIFYQIHHLHTDVPIFLDLRTFRPTFSTSLTKHSSSSFKPFEERSHNIVRRSIPEGEAHIRLCLLGITGADDTTSTEHRQPSGVSRLRDQENLRSRVVSSDRPNRSRARIASDEHIGFVVPITSLLRHFPCFLPVGRVKPLDCVFETVGVHGVQ